MGVLYFLIGALFIPFFLLMGMMAPSGTEGFGFGTMFALAMPILYGIFGIIGGAIGAALYNVIAGWIGGIEFDIDPA